MNHKSQRLLIHSNSKHTYTRSSLGEIIDCPFWWIDPKINLLFFQSLSRLTINAGNIYNQKSAACFHNMEKWDYSQWRQKNVSIWTGQEKSFLAQLNFQVSPVIFSSRETSWTSCGNEAIFWRTAASPDAAFSRSCRAFTSSSVWKSAPGVCLVSVGGQGSVKRKNEALAVLPAELR